MTPQPIYLPTPNVLPEQWWTPERYDLPNRDITAKRKATLLAQLLPPMRWDDE